MSFNPFDDLPEAASEGVRERGTKRRKTESASEGVAEWKEIVVKEEPLEPSEGVSEGVSNAVSEGVNERGSEGVRERGSKGVSEGVGERGSEAVREQPGAVDVQATLRTLERHIGTAK